MRSWRLLLPVLLAASLPAPAFVTTFDSTSGAPRHWSLLVPFGSVDTNVVNPNTHAVRYFLAADAYSTTNTAAELNALRASFGQWMAISNTYLKFEEGGLIPHVSDINVGDHTNEIFWARTNQFVNGGLDNISGVLGLTYTSWAVPANVLVEADMVFNGYSRAWYTDFNDPANTNIFVEGTALHEIGHFIGLQHSPLGGATMLFRGATGVNVQAGLSPDEISAARFLYPAAANLYGALQGTVTKDGSPVFGAAVFAQNSASNVVAGTVTASDGTYYMPALVPGDYQVRCTPLDPATSVRLCAGQDISSAYNSADVNFLPTTTTSTTISANASNTVDFAVVNSTLPFRISRIRSPSAVSGSYTWNSTPTTIHVGQSNYFIGVASASLPTNGSSLAISGDGLTLGSPTYVAFTENSAPLYFVSVPISVSSNATPGLRNFIITQGSDVTYAMGFLEVQPAVFDYNFDGLDDVFQRKYFPVFTDLSAAPGADPDGDGMINAAEYVAGTNPTNAASLLRIQSVARTNTTATVVWQSVSGKRYQISDNTNLVTATWQNVGPVITGSNSTAQVTDPAATNNLRVYRVQVVP